MLCPCGSDQAYSTCCEIFLSGKRFPSTPEKLMRSRYTAYTLANIDYIQQTMRSPAADHFDPLSAKEWAERTEWVKLEVLNARMENDLKGFVEFIAHMKMNGKHQILHEISEFHFLNDKWFYIDGIGPQVKTPIHAQKISRNDPCICGSGSKYKKCCGLTK